MLDTIWLGASPMSPQRVQLSNSPPGSGTRLSISKNYQPEMEDFRWALGGLPLGGKVKGRRYDFERGDGKKDNLANYYSGYDAFAFSPVLPPPPSRTHIPPPL